MQLPTPPTPPVPPVPPVPALPGAPDVAPTDVGTTGLVGARTVPRTAQELAGLRGLREELSSQLLSAQRRRSSVLRDLRRADDASRPGLEQRLTLLDRRIVQVEGDIAETGRLITSASPALLAAQAPGGLVLVGPNGPSANAVPALLLLVALLQVVMLLRTRVGRRGPVFHDRALADFGQRMARLEQAVDAIAVEVERVSEGQRFVTRVLAESRAGAQLAAPGDTVDAPAAQYARPNG